MTTGRLHRCWSLFSRVPHILQKAESRALISSPTTQRHSLHTLTSVIKLQIPVSCFPMNKSSLCIYGQRNTCLQGMSAVMFFNQTRCSSTVPKDLKTSRLLTGRLNVSKKKGRTQKLKDDMNAAAFVVGDSIDLVKLKRIIKEEGLYEVIALPGDIKNAIMATAIYKVEGKVRDIFFFGDGRVGCWNMLENERTEVLRTVLRCTSQPFTMEDILEEEEVQPVMFDRTTMFANSTIYLRTPAEEQTEQTFDEEVALQKFAFSDAMGQTVILSFCESKLDAFTDKIELEMEKLRDGTPSRMVITDINKNRGEVFLLRHEINLESDLLDTPDLYWEREDLEGLYKALTDYYNIRLRILVFNERLNYCSDFLELLCNQHNDAKHVFLEKVIIALILIEVVFGGIPYLQEYLPSLLQLGNNDVTQEITTDIANSANFSRDSEISKGAENTSLNK